MRYSYFFCTFGTIALLISACIPPSESSERSAKNKPSFSQSSYAIQPAVNTAIIDTLFKEAYRVFEHEEYARAIELFKKHNDLDSIMMNYESYPFIAESYYRLGQKELGIQACNEAIDKNSKLPKDINTAYLSELRREELAAWKAGYPLFPAVLKKENGFRPYDVWPSVTYRKEPRYPYRAVQEGIEGTVYLKALIDEDGNVEKVSLVKSDNNILDMAAFQAVEKWKFSPYMKKGIQTKIEIIVPVIFRIPQE